MYVVIETSARLLRLLTLLQGRRFWAGSDLADRLEITGRTLRRDVERLRRLGYPVQATPGVAGGYQLAAGAQLPPLQLEDDEALAVSLGLATLTSSTLRGIDEAALRAQVKLERVLPARLRTRASALRASIQLLERSGPRVSPDLLSLLASAVSDHIEVDFRYQSGNGKASRRSVDPVGLVHTGHRWYLVAWDRDKDDWRTFRVDRISGDVTPGARFSPRPLPNDGDLRGYVSRALSVDAYGHQAKVVLHAPLEQVAERVSPAAGVLERIDARRCRLLTGAHSFETLALFISLIGVEFDVEEPQGLVDALREIHGRVGRTLERGRGVRGRRGR